MENKGNSLAKISLAINVVLIIAVIILFVKMPSGSKSEDIVDSNDSTSVEMPVIKDDGQLNICYFQADSLQNNLLLMTEIQDLIAGEQKKAEDRMRAKEREIQRWQESWNTGGQLLPSEQRKFQEEAAQKEQEIGMFQQQVQMDLAQAQESHMFNLISRISAASKNFAQDNGYDFVLSYQLGQNIYYGSPSFDITDQLVKIMNDDYTSKSSTDEEAEVEAVD